MRRPIVIINQRSGGIWWRVPLALFLWLCFAAPIVSGLYVVHVVRGHAEGLPIAPNLASWAASAPRSNTIVAADGSLLAELPFNYQGQSGHRFPVQFEEIPLLVVQAILAAEDVRFFQHHGVDARAVIRSAWNNYQAGHIVEGASTITQQLARNITPDIGNERSLRRKVREALLARRIEQHHDKREIFESYVNFVFLGANAYGFTAGARAYFSKSLDELDAAEAALLAGLIQIPGRGNPYLSPRVAMERRDVVLLRMHRAGFLDDGAFDEAAKATLLLTPPIKRYGQLAPWATEAARIFGKHFTPELFARGGLRIETTISPTLAFESEAIARSHTAGLPNEDGEIPQVGAVLFDHSSGYIQVLVGGRDWQESKYNRALQSCRQPGSAFKPIVYGAALASNTITPATALRDGPISEYDPELLVHWKPSNSGREFRGLAVAQDALALSLNTPAVDVYDRVGGDAVVAFAKRLGVHTPLKINRPLALGASCVIPVELATAFAAIANGGYAVTPIIVTRIFHRGERIFDRSVYFDPAISAHQRLDRLSHVSGETSVVLDANTAFQLRSMLRAVVTRGTGKSARNMAIEVAGKTGTTNDNVDAWFVGFSSRVTAAVWVGHDNPRQNLGRGRDGSHAALPLWKQLMTLSDPDNRGLALPGPVPIELQAASIDRDSGFLAAPKSGGGMQLYFKPGTVPTEVAGHGAQVTEDFARSTASF